MTFVSGDQDKKCVKWKYEEGKTEQQHSYEGHSETVELIEFNHDGKLMATGGLNNVLRVWDTATGELKCLIEEGPDQKDDM